MKQLIYRGAECLFNTRDKYYPLQNGTLELAQRMVFSEPKFNPQGLESITKKSDTYYKFNENDSEVNENEAGEAGPGGSERAFKRARLKCYDYMRCNPDMNMFITLTMSQDIVKRDSYTDIIKRLNTYLDNKVRRDKLKYILVPEYHKDGNNIHLHGVCNEEASELTRAINPHTEKPLFRNGKAVYNVSDYKLGFSTAIRIGGSVDDIKRTSKYVWKYMTKAYTDGQNIAEKIGGRYYLHGGLLREPIFEYSNTEYSNSEGWEKDITHNLKVKIKTYE